MRFPSNKVRIVVATKPIDFRKGRDDLLVLWRPCCARIRSPAMSLCSVRAGQTG
jgi:hypothetical protein